VAQYAFMVIILQDFDITSNGVSTCKQSSPTVTTTANENTRNVKLSSLNNGTYTLCC